MSEQIFEVPERVLQKRREWAEGDAKRDAGLTEPADVVKYRDLSYGPFGEFNLLDIYRPEKAEGALPVIVNIHGGGYFYGDKELYRFYAMRLAQFGFAVVNFNYRLAPQYHFPAPLLDIHAVLGFMVAHAQEYQLDLQNVFLIGDSAGAQLAMNYAVIDSDPGYAALLQLTKHAQIQVRAVSLACGIYDLRDRQKAITDDDILSDYLGDLSLLTDEVTNAYAHIDANFPPAFVFSGKDDFLLLQCAPMAEHIRCCGAVAEDKVFGLDAEGEVPHVFHVDMYSKPGQEANEAQIAFMKKHIVLP